MYCLYKNIVKSSFSRRMAATTIQKQHLAAIILNTITISLSIFFLRGEERLYMAGNSRRNV